MIDMIPVESSNIAAVGYDESNEEMHVEFNNGSTYVYKNVPEDVYQNLVAADSVGSFFHTHVRSVYEFSKL